MGGDGPLYRDRAWLRDQYWGEKKSATVIAEEVGVDRTTIARWLRHHEIPRRPEGHPTNLDLYNRYYWDVDADWVEGNF